MTYPAMMAPGQQSLGVADYGAGEVFQDEVGARTTR